jgi:hypothetical protein
VIAIFEILTHGIECWGHAFQGPFQAFLAVVSDLNEKSKRQRPREQDPIVYEIDPTGWIRFSKHNG